MATKIEEVRIVPRTYHARAAANAAFGEMGSGAHSTEDRKTVRVVVTSPGGERSGVDVTVRGCCVNGFIRNANRLNGTAAIEVTPDAPWPGDVVNEATADEVRAQLESFKARVGDVALKYARAHDLCSVVEMALQEIGIEPPKRQKLRLTITLPTSLGFEQNGEKFNFTELADSYQVARRFRSMLREVGISESAQSYITERKYVDVDNDGEEEDED
ncbi:hypothetical protein ACFP2T_35895 [Plantactinospora solaniradicis]|uniref:Uncharacterized protein n=1 Tax=Plantactinospora solaniradicis TaxID=1723736 RepID=A0ABW1KIE3_9ACTN